jgi:hypothetical protein
MPTNDEVTHARLLQYRDSLTLEIARLQEAIRGVDIVLRALSTIQPPGRPPDPIQAPQRPEPALRPRRYTKAPTPEQPTAKKKHKKKPLLKRSGIQDILDFVRETGRVTSKDVARHFNQPIGTASSRLSNLRTAGHLVNDKPHYYIPPVKPV